MGFTHLTTFKVLEAVPPLKVMLAKMTLGGFPTPAEAVRNLFQAGGVHLQTDHATALTAQPLTCVTSSEHRRVARSKMFEHWLAVEPLHPAQSPFIQV